MQRLNELPLQVSGWFAVEYSKAVSANKEKQIMVAGTDYLLSRTKEGELLLNRECKNILEQNDMIYIWVEKNGAPPQWNVPKLDENGWSDFMHHQIRIHSHLQEIYENSIDLAHFKRVHNFTHLTLEEKPCFDDHKMTVKHAIQRRNIFLQYWKDLTAFFELRLYGLGCAHTHIYVPAFKQFIRMMTMATMCTTHTVDIRIAIAWQINQTKRYSLFQTLLQHIIYKSILHDFYQDLPIWSNKKYLQKPLLVKGDGQIIQFRQWCQQFY